MERDEKKGKKGEGHEKMCKNGRKDEKQTIEVNGQDLEYQEDFKLGRDDYFLEDLYLNLTSEEDTSAAWWFQREQDRENHHVSGNWYWQRGNLKHSEYPSATYEPWMSMGSEDRNPDWYFARAEWGEFYRNDPRWMFGRAKSRAFQRDKPWYVERAEKRSDAHHKYKDN